MPPVSVPNVYTIPPHRAFADALAVDEDAAATIPGWFIAVLMLCGFASAATATWYFT